MSADKKNREDTRIVYSVHGTWWDSIHEVATVVTGSGHELPVCPACNSALFEMPDIEAWWKGVDKYDETHPGYRAFIEWLRGKCFPSYQAAARAYTAETGKEFKL